MTVALELSTLKEYYQTEAYPKKECVWQKVYSLPTKDRHPTLRMHNRSLAQVLCDEIKRAAFSSIASKCWSQSVRHSPTSGVNVGAKACGILQRRE
jgi:hypothetical protein